MTFFSSADAVEAAVAAADSGRCTFNLASTILL